jgi:transcriptional regulator with XRE-family HTH domain
MTGKTKTRSTTQVDIALGIRVRQARLEAKLSQSDLGDKLGVTFQQVQKYEKGMNRVPPQRLVDISKALGRPVDWFLQSPTYKPNTTGERLARFAASRLGHQLLEAALPLNAQMQQALVTFTRTLTKEAA